MLFVATVILVAVILLFLCNVLKSLSSLQKRCLYHPKKTSKTHPKAIWPSAFRKRFCDHFPKKTLPSTHQSSVRERCHAHLHGTFHAVLFIFTVGVDPNSDRRGSILSQELSCNLRQMTTTKMCGIWATCFQKNGRTFCHIALVSSNIGHDGQDMITDVTQRILQTCCCGVHGCRKLLTKLQNDV